MSKKFKLKISKRLVNKKVRKRAFLNNKACRFCANKELEDGLDYKNVATLKGFVTERSKILPSRVSGNCFFHQRILASHIKTARIMALLPFCPIAT